MDFPPLSGRALQLHALAVLKIGEAPSPGVLPDELVERILTEEVCDISDRALAVADLVESARWIRLESDDGYRIVELAP